MQELVTPVFVLVNGTPAEVLFAGAAPGLPGVDQINVRIPVGTSPGAAKIQVLSQVVPAQGGLAVAVR